MLKFGKLELNDLQQTLHKHKRFSALPSYRSYYDLYLICILGQIPGMMGGQYPVTPRMPQMSGKMTGVTQIAQLGESPDVSLKSRLEYK